MSNESDPVRAEVDRLLLMAMSLIENAIREAVAGDRFDLLPPLMAALDAVWGAAGDAP